MSPDLAESIVLILFFLQNLITFIVSVIVPHWFNFIIIPSIEFRLTAFFSNPIFVQVKSSAIISQLLSINFFFNFLKESKSFSKKGSSIKLTL